MYVVKEFKWGCAHLLEGHKGLCKNIHGHTYTLQVGVKGHKDYKLDSSEEGMIIDFKDLKGRVNELIVNKFDHAFVVNITTKDEFTIALRLLMKNHGKKIVELPFRTTAENMVQWMTEVLEHDGFELAFVRLYETETSYAEVRYEI